MDDGFDAAFELGAQRDDVAPVALGDDALLQHGRGARVVDHALQAGHQALVRNFDLAPDGSQLIRGVIEHLAALREHAADGFHHALRRGQGFADARQGGVGFALAGEAARQLAGGDEGGLDIQQVGGFQHAAARCQDGLRAHVVRAADADGIVDAQQPAGLRGARLELGDLSQDGGGAQGLHQGGRGAEGGVTPQAFQDFIVFKGMQGLLVHNMRSLP